jgi:hypothetical protein
MDEGLSLFLALRVRGYKGLWLGVTTNIGKGDMN